MFLCAADSSGQNLESSGSICNVKTKEFRKQSKRLLSNIKLLENWFTLTTNLKKKVKCQSNDYLPFYKRVEEAINYSILGDCNIILKYNTISYENKYAYCLKHFGDEVKLEIKLLSFGSSELYNSLSDCVYKTVFTKKLNEVYMQSEYS